MSDKDLCSECNHERHVHQLRTGKCSASGHNLSTHEDVYCYCRFFVEPKRPAQPAPEEDVVNVVVPVSFACLYRALVGVEAMDRASAYAFMRGIAKNPDQATRIERICAQIDSDNPLTGLLPPMDYLHPDGSISRTENGRTVFYPAPTPPTSTVFAERIEAMELAHAQELGAVTLERDETQRELELLRERHERFVGNLRTVDIVAQGDGHDAEWVKQQIHEMLSWE